LDEFWTTTGGGLFVPDPPGFPEPDPEADAELAPVGIFRRGGQVVRTSGGGVVGFGCGKRKVIVESGCSESVLDSDADCEVVGSEFPMVGGTGMISESVVSESSDGDADRSSRTGGSSGDQEDGDESGESKGSGESENVRSCSELLGCSKVRESAEVLSGPTGPRTLTVGTS